MAKSKDADGASVQSIVRWHRCNFDRDESTERIIYCDGEHDKCQPCNHRRLTVEDVEAMAAAHGRLGIVKQQLMNIEFNITRGGSTLPTQEEWERILRSMIDSCGST